MRLHTDIVTREDVIAATEGLTGVSAIVTERRSKTHARGIEMVLEGNGTRAGYATKSVQSATWDEYGVVLGRLFEIDPNMRVGDAKHPTYDGRYDFSLVTNDRYEGGRIPDDMHVKHLWEWRGQTRTCKKCTAVVWTG